MASCRAFLNLSTSRFFVPKLRSSNISEARWHRWIGLPKSDTFVRWGTEQALGSNEWESTHARFIMTRFCGPKSMVKCSRFGKILAKNHVSNAVVKRFQQIPQTILSPVFFWILGVKVFIASKWLRSDCPLTPLTTFWRSFVEDPSNDVWVPRNRYPSESKNFQRDVAGGSYTLYVFFQACLPVGVSSLEKIRCAKTRGLSYTPIQMIITARCRKTMKYL